MDEGFEIGEVVSIYGGIVVGEIVGIYGDNYMVEFFDNGVIKTKQFNKAEVLTYEIY